MLAHILRSLHGVWRLAMLDERGMDSIENTHEGFWRSFLAAVVLLPVFFLLIAMERPPPGLEPPPTFRLIAVESIGYIVKWTAFPLAALPMVSGLKRDGRYFGFIAALNWAQVIEMIPGLILIALTHTVLPESAAGTAQFALLAAFLMYEWYITKISLDISGLAAAGLTFVSFAIWLFLMSSIQMLLYSAQLPPN